MKCRYVITTEREGKPEKTAIVIEAGSKEETDIALERVLNECKVTPKTISHDVTKA
jgi:hypothetical protein